MRARTRHRPRLWTMIDRGVIMMHDGATLMMLPQDADFTIALHTDMLIHTTTADDEARYRISASRGAFPRCDAREAFDMPYSIAMRRLIRTGMEKYAGRHSLIVSRFVSI